jgi:hypothetical protein
VAALRRTLAMMAASTPNPRVRGGLEAALRVSGPALDLLLVAANRVSRILEHRDRGYAMVRMEHDGGSAPRTLDGYPRRSGTV